MFAIKINNLSLNYKVIVSKHFKSKLYFFRTNLSLSVHNPEPVV